MRPQHLPSSAVRRLGVQSCQAAAIATRIRQAAVLRLAAPHSQRWHGHTRAATVSSAAAASADSAVSSGPNHLFLTYADLLRKGPSKLAALPPPPPSSTLTAVIPWLIQLAMAESSKHWRIVLAFSCLVCSKAAGMLGPFMMKQAIDAFSTSPVEPARVVIATATKFLLLYGLCDMLKHTAKELQSPIFTPVSQAVARRVAYHTFSHVLDLDVKFHLDRRTGRLSRILERGTRSIQMLYRAVIFTFAPTALELLIVCGVLAKTFNPLVGGLVLVTFAVYVSWSVHLTQMAAEARKRVNELDNLASAKAVDALLSYETVTLFNNQKLEVGQYNEYLKGYFKATMNTERLAAVLNAGQSIVLAAGLVGIMCTALNVSQGGAVSAGDVVMIQGLLLQLWAPLQFLGWFYRELRSALVDMEDFFAILRSRSSLVNGTRDLPPQPVRAPLAMAPASLAADATAALHHGAPTRVPVSANGNGHHVLDLQPMSMSGAQPQHQGVAEAGVQGQGLAVQLRDVHFAYNPDRQILRGVSLDLMPGRSLAVVGPSGSGKSTILKMLTRLYDTTAGSVSLNGVNVRDLKMESLRDAVAVVPQDTVLFNDTILQNIRYGRPDSSDEEVLAAAQMAHLHEAVARMPDGYSTMVGERGLKLSGGEKQRVAIARAFLRQPRLLICDEATSALDSETESQIMSSLAELAQGRTSVFVAHRLSTIRNCDTIVVLRDGVVVESGSHDTLMNQPDGVYASMWQLQAEEQEHDSNQDVADHSTSASLAKASNFVVA